jgi:hypothetical protein
MPIHSPAWWLMPVFPATWEDPNSKPVFKVLKSVKDTTISINILVAKVCDCGGGVYLWPSYIGREFMVYD